MQRFGFVFNAGGVHFARTMMVEDLGRILTASSNFSTLEQFAVAIEEDNVLGKRTAQSRKLTARHLSKLYGLDCSVPLFRAFRFLWGRDQDGRRLLCLLISYARDTVLRSSAPFIFALHQNDSFVREELEVFIDDLQPGRFSDATLKSTAQNLAGTWTQSGHLVGRVKKIRRLVAATPGSIAFALLLGYLAGERGELLFESEYLKLLDSSPTRAIDLAHCSARHGWIDLKRIGSVVEVAFPLLLTDEERELIREQD